MVLGQFSWHRFFVVFRHSFLCLRRHQLSQKSIDRGAPLGTFRSYMYLSFPKRPFKTKQKHLENEPRKHPNGAMLRLYWPADQPCAGITLRVQIQCLLRVILQYLSTRILNAQNAYTQKKKGAPENFRKIVSRSQIFGVQTKPNLHPHYFIILLFQVPLALMVT